MLAPAGTPMHACLALWVTSISPLATVFPTTAYIVSSTTGYSSSPQRTACFVGTQCR